MSIAENKALVRRYFEEVWNNGHETGIDDMCAATGVVYGLDGKPVSGIGALKTFHTKFHSAFSDHHVEIEDMVAEGDRVVVRWTRTATHTGPAFGHAPTGKHLTFRGVTILRIEDGKLAEGWNYYDRVVMLEQLGIVPAVAAM